MTSQKWPVLAKKAARLSGFQNPRMLDTLAAAYAEVGEFEQIGTPTKASPPNWDTHQSKRWVSQK